MKPIKTYLLPLCLLIFFSSQAFSQNSFEEEKKEAQKKEQQLSKTDSILVNTYYTEEDYNRLHGINPSKVVENSKFYCGDEIYNEEVRIKKNKGAFLDAVAAEIIVDVVLHTVFIIATFWH